jgi:addiction module RelE/StbE family toxin
MYKIHYLPIALDDLKDIVRYIVHTLESPQAAKNLISKIDKEVLKTAENPFRCPLYTTSEKLKYDYRVLHINNYSLFYAVENEKIEIHRIIYSRRDMVRILKAQETPDIRTLSPLRRIENYPYRNSLRKTF